MEFKRSLTISGGFRGGRAGSAVTHGHVS